MKMIRVSVRGFCFLVFGFLFTIACGAQTEEDLELLMIEVELGEEQQEELDSKVGKLKEEVEDLEGRDLTVNENDGTTLDNTQTENNN